MEEKVIIAKFGKTKVAQTEKQWRYNHGQKLKFEGVDLPANYEVHFSNSKTGTAKTVIGNEDGALIPYEYFLPGSMIYAWIYVEEDGVGVTRREVRIPIDQKALPTDQQPLPEEQTVIEQAIESLNTAVNEIPNTITAALSAAKESGEFDGTSIWWSFTGIVSAAPNHDGRILKRALNGKQGELPLVGDFVYGPEIGSENLSITDLYIIEEISGVIVYLKHLDSIKGADGFDPEIVVEEIPNGHRVTITSAAGSETFDVMNGEFNVTGDLSMENYRLTELADGVDDTDAVNKAQVDRMIREGSGLFRGSFSTKASLNMAAWQSTDPTQPYYVDNNDYCVVLSDETQHYECWRYGYVVGSGWAAQYRINEAPMTAAQIAAINSGITADRLVGLEQFKNTAQPKLNGIESGAEVNKIAKIRAWNSETSEYVDLPINNKSVDLPQSSGGSELPDYQGTLYDNLFLHASYPNGALSWENVRDIYWINAELVNGVVSFDQSLGDINSIVNTMIGVFRLSKRLPVIKLQSGEQTYTLPLVHFHPANLGENSSFHFCSVVDADTILSIGLYRRSTQHDYFASYDTIYLTLNGIISKVVPNPNDKDVIYYSPVTEWTAKQLEASDISGAYEKPVNGIPAEDLDPNVPVLPNGGSIFQVLRKLSDDDYDYDWTSQTFVVTVTYSNDEYSADNSFENIELAIEAGVEVAVVYGSEWYKLTFLSASPTFALFSRINGTEADTIYIDDQGNVSRTATSFGTYSKPSGGIPATDLASGVIPSVPSASSATPQPLGTAAAGSSSDYSRADHVHAKPTYSKSDVGLGNVDNVQQYSATNPPPYPVSSVNGQTGAVSLSIPSTAADIGAAPAVTEVTISTAGAVTQALDAGKIYHFTGALTSLTITLNAAGSGQLAQYHFDFDCGSTAPTVTIPNTVTMPSGNSFDASKHYEVDILNNYGAVMAWATS